MKKTAMVFALVVALGIGLVGSALAGLDFGLDTQNRLNAQSQPLFGVGKPIAASSQDSIDAETADADPTNLVTLAKGLSAKVVSAAANLGPNTDMMALWPDTTNPTWLIACNEESESDPGVQRIRISDGLVETIVVSGLESCDPSRITPWGTIVFAEEDGPEGQLFELIDPLNTTGVAIEDGTGAHSHHVAAGLRLRQAEGGADLTGRDRSDVPLVLLGGSRDHHGPGR